jgi:hypothetical protein
VKDTPQQWQGQLWDQPARQDLLMTEAINPDSRSATAGDRPLTGFAATALDSLVSCSGRLLFDSERLVSCSGRWLLGSEVSRGNTTSNSRARWQLSQAPEVEVPGWPSLGDSLITGLRSCQLK